MFEVDYLLAFFKGFMTRKVHGSSGGGGSTIVADSCVVGALLARFWLLLRAFFVRGG